MVFLIIFVITITLILIISLQVYRIVFYSPKNKRNTLDDPMHGTQYEAVAEYIIRIGRIMEHATCETITITSFDGCKLSARYYHLKDDAPLEILFHGYRSCSFRDCAGAHALSRKLGFNALIVDQRAHGDSDGITITFGIKEHLDCLRWIEYANERFDNKTPLVLFGISMGAATVLMASGSALPDNVACVIADSPYSSPVAIIEKVCNDLRYPVALCRPFIHLSAFLWGNFRLNSCSAKEAVTHAKIPLLLIHGEADELVPLSMSYEIAACCASFAAVEAFRDAGHGLSYITDPLRYEKTILDFISSVPSVSDKISDSFRHQYPDQNL